MFDTYQIVNTSFSVLSILVYVGGFFACVSFRKLSPMLLLAATGFAGLIVSSASARLCTYLLTSTSPDLEVLIYIAAGVVDVIANVLLVAGLWFALNEIRRRVALSLEPNHGGR